MINNRQGNRRRGRNNGPRQNNRGGDNGNRIDNRARGNAAQLLEKYKNLARDAQTQGDRVQTEYYLQFADHYFRVLNDVRQRQEEQQRQRQDDRGPRDGNGYVADGDDGYGNDAGNSATTDTDDYADAPPVAPRAPRAPRRDEERDSGQGGDRRGRRREFTSRDGSTARAPKATDDDEAGLGIDAALLPPAIARNDGDGFETEREDMGQERSAPSDAAESDQPTSAADAEEAPAKPRRGRPRKVPAVAETADAAG